MNPFHKPARKLSSLRVPSNRDLTVDSFRHLLRDTGVPLMFSRFTHFTSVSNVQETVCVVRDWIVINEKVKDQVKQMFKETHLSPVVQHRQDTSFLRITCGHATQSKKMLSIEFDNIPVTHAANLIAIVDKIKARIQAKQQQPHSTLTQNTVATSSTWITKSV